MKKIIKDSLKRLKKNITISLIIVIIITIFNDKITINGRKDTYPIYLFIFCLVYNITATTIFYFKNKPSKLDIKYFREHPKNYSPSIVSIILDLKLDCKKDLLADILYLENQKIISINYKYNSINIIKEYNSLKPHLQTLCKYIEENKNLTIKELIDLFPSHLYRLTYEKECIDESISLGYITKDKKVLGPIKFFFYIYLMFTIYVIVCALLNNQNIFEGVFISTFIFIALFSIMFPTLFIINLIQRLFLKERYFTRTELGKKEVKEWLAYYDFLNDFTLIHQKDLEYNELLDYEYAYAVGLGININLKKKYDIETGEIIR